MKRGKQPHDPTRKCGCGRKASSPWAAFCDECRSARNREAAARSQRKHYHRNVDASRALARLRGRPRRDDDATRRRMAAIVVLHHVRAEIDRMLSEQPEELDIWTIRHLGGVLSEIRMDIRRRDAA